MLQFSAIICILFGGTVFAATNQGTQNNPETKTKLAAAIVFAKDKPLQLVTLMTLAALPKTGANAGTS